MACSRPMRPRALSIVLVSACLSSVTWAETPAQAPPPTAQPVDLHGKKAQDARSRKAALPEKDRARLSALLEELATLWERVSAETERARQLETAADQKEQELVAIEGRTERARLLIEQTEARRARALARLKEIEGTSSR